MAGLLLSFPQAVAAELTLSDNGQSAGYLTLSWADVRGNSFELKYNTSEGWDTLYTGGDRATTLSGLPDGRYEFQLIADGIQVGEPLVVIVEHHSLGRAFAFFSVGAAMFLVLAMFLITQGRKSAKNDHTLS